MAWRDELRPASFRGVSFFVREARTETGKLADEHVFPGRGSSGEAVRVAELGRGPLRFSVEAYVVGDDYLERRDALEAALSEPGPGRLVHPYRGERTVSVVGAIATTESKADGGRATVSFSCVDVTDGGLTREVDTEALAERDLDAYLADVARDFETSYDTEGVPAVWQEESRTWFDEATEALRTAHDTIAQGVGAISDFDARVSAFSADLQRLASAPGAAAAALAGAIESVLAIPSETASALRQSFATTKTAVDTILGATRDLFRFGEGAPLLPTTTTNRVAETRLRKAVFDLMRGLTLGHAARAVLTLPFASRSHAAAIREELVEAFDTLVEEGSAGGETVSGARLYQRLSAARASTARHLARVAASLPDVRTLTLDEEIPALALAHELYGDARREIEIVGRNAPRNPGRLRVGVAYEVLRV